MSDETPEWEYNQKEVYRLGRQFLVSVILHNGGPHHASIIERIGGDLTQLAEYRSYGGFVIKSINPDILVDEYLMFDGITLEATK